MPIDLRNALAVPKVADGGWATELDNLGCPPGFCREQWNLLHADQVAQVASSYVQAGAEIILTNTYGANAFVLERYGLSDKVEVFNRTGAAISRQAAGEKVWVFGSMGPSGKMLAVQEVTEADLYKAFFAQAKALAAGGVDAIVCETMVELAEALTAVRTAKDATGLPVVASMTFDTGPEYLQTSMGTAAGEAAEKLSNAGADAIGCNCGIDIDSCIKVVQCMRQQTDLPIWAKPNAALPEIQADKVIYRQTPDEFVSKVGMLVKSGANVVGGCCGTGPAHISKLASVLKGWRAKG